MTTPAEHPIPFTGDMLCAVVTCARCGQISIPFPCQHCGSTEFRKTQTRRVMKTQPSAGVRESPFSKRG